MKWYGLLGKTLKHSFSKAYFTDKFQALNITDSGYENFELEAITDLPHLLKNNPSIAGLNITVPYKEEVLAFLDEQNKIVQEIKACNCIRISGGRLSGYNTDVIGFQKSLEKHLESYHTHALVLGTGGAAKAVQYVLKTLGISFQSVSRIKKKSTITYDELDEIVLKSHNLIINTTPLGMFPNIEEAPPIPFHFLTAKHLLFDLIYNPQETIFLKRGKTQGAKTENGLEMLILQAEESWRIWSA